MEMETLTPPEAASFNPFVGSHGGGGGTQQKQQHEHVFDEVEVVEFLPPGFRFHPTDEEIIVHYLRKKVFDNSFTSVAVTEVDLNKCEPWDLPRKAKMMGKKEWFFFWQKDRKYPTGTRTNRATESGYWKATGKDKEIFQSGKVGDDSNGIVGMKKTLVFYKGRAPKGLKTNWIMHEYRLQPSNLPYNHFCNTTNKEEWVVCRVFHKNPGINNNNNMRRSSPPHSNDVVSRIDDSIVDHLLQSPSRLPPLIDFPEAPSRCLNGGDDLQKPAAATFFYQPRIHLPNPHSASAMMTTAALKAESVSLDTGAGSADVAPAEVSSVAIWEQNGGGGVRALEDPYDDDDNMADLDRYYSSLLNC